MTTEQKFNAAVNVIRNLPKDGAYQPSNDLQLRFYSYYKQATEGPCTKPKPSFWSVVERAKWEAWMRLGNMSRTEAMNNYVEELKKIVETMSYTDNVADFLSSLDSFYEHVPQEDLELLVGPVLERVRSQPGSPLSGSPIGSRETSPHRVRNASRYITSSLETSPATSHSGSPLPPDTDGEEEEFKDTVEIAPERLNKDATKSSTSLTQIGNSNKVPKTVNPVELTNGYANGHMDNHERGRSREKKDEKMSSDYVKHIEATLRDLQKDVERLSITVRTLEEYASNSQSHKMTKCFIPKWWPISECSPRMFVFLLMWPFVAQGFLAFAQRYRQRKL